jgi:hypothetical protein
MSILPLFPAYDWTINGASFCISELLRKSMKELDFSSMQRFDKKYSYMYFFFICID